MHIEQVQGSQQPHNVMIDGCSLSKSNQRTQGLASACAIKKIKLSSQRNDARHVGMQLMMLRMPMQLFAECDSTQRDTSPAKEKQHALTACCAIAFDC